MLSHIVIFLVSLAFVAKGADYFVEYSGRIAKRLGVSDFIIGLTVTSIGTTIPELATSVSASLEGHTDLIMGNVLGSIIANIGLILGVSAAFHAFRTEKKMYLRDGYFMIAGIILLFGMALNNRITSMEGVIFLFFYVVYLLFVFYSNRGEKAYHFRDFMHYVFDFPYMPSLRDRFYRIAHRKTTIGKTGGESESGGSEVFTRPFLKDTMILVLSCIMLIAGAEFMVEEAILIARISQLPESIIGLSIIAVGTSIPELTVALSAVRRGKGEMVLGNIVGSTIANTLFITGISALFRPMDVEERIVTYTMPVVLFFSLTLLYFIRSDWQVKRWQGVVCLVSYILFLVFAFVQEWK